MATSWGSAGIARTLCAEHQIFQAETALLYFETVAGARETDNTSSIDLFLSVKNNDGIIPYIRYLGSLLY